MPDKNELKQLRIRAELKVKNRNTIYNEIAQTQDGRIDPRKAPGPLDTLLVSVVEDAIDRNLEIINVREDVIETLNYMIGQLTKAKNAVKPQMKHAG